MNGMRRRWLVAGVASLVVGVAPAAAQDEVRARDTLYTVTEPLKIRLEADWRAVFRNRDPDVNENHPGRLLVANGPKVDTIAVSVRTRGNFRLKECAIPPVMILFDQGGRPGTHFAGQRRLKLVTHCRDNDRYEQNNHVEYLIYKLYNLLTEQSFGARRIEATWVDTGRNTESVKPAFIIEEERHLGERLEGVLDGAPIGFDESVPLATTRLALFQLMLGNTDWSQPGQHNIVMLNQGGVYTPLPYDFDWSGLVNAPYAKPDPSLNLRNVRERQYRGPCVPQAVFVQALGELHAVQDAMMAEVDKVTGLAPNRVTDVKNYLGSFFREVPDFNQLQRRYLQRCRGSGE